MATSAGIERPRPDRPSTRRLTGGIAVISLLASLVLAAALAWTMSRGADPALRPGAIASAAQSKPPRRIVKTVVVRRVVSSPGSRAPVASTSSVSAPAAAAAAPVTSGVS